MIGEGDEQGKGSGGREHEVDMWEKVLEPFDQDKEEEQKRKIGRRPLVKGRKKEKGLG